MSSICASSTLSALAVSLSLAHISSQALWDFPGASPCSSPFWSGAPRALPGASQAFRPDDPAFCTFTLSVSSHQANSPLRRAPVCLRASCPHPAAPPSTFIPLRGGGLLRQPGGPRPIWDPVLNPFRPGTLVWRVCGLMSLLDFLWTILAFSLCASQHLSSPSSPL